jgi:hypothetical protein
MNRTRLMLALAALLIAPLAHAQTAGTIVFTAEVTAAANGTVTPKLTWTTTPAATSCSASGGWTGAKAATGSETLAAITKSANYRIDCSWSDTQAKISWTPPTQNTDGSTLTDLAGTKIYYGTSPTALSSTKTVAGAGVTSTTISPLAAGTWYFAAAAFTSSGAESENSAVVSKTTGTAVGNRSVALAVNIPQSPSNVTAQ